MSRCARCDASDGLLFTCSHCDHQFCVDHQFPHHACARFTREGGAGRGDGFRFGDGTVVRGPRTDRGSSAAERGADEASVATGGPSESSADPTAVPGPRIEVARDAARETRPDRTGPTPPPPGRGMPWERGDASVAAWMREQTYPSYLLKVGGLSLLLTTAYYGGLAVTLYGYL